MSAAPESEKSVIVYFDDSTGEVYTEKDGHFHFTDLSGTHFREHEHRRGDQHRDDQRKENAPSAPSSSAGLWHENRGRGATGFPVDLLGEGLLNTLLAAGINVPIETYRAHQEEVRRQHQLQRKKEQQTQRATHPRVRALHGGRGSPLLVRRLSEQNADAYIAAMKQAWQDQRRLQAERQLERELQNQIGGNGRDGESRSSARRQGGRVTIDPVHEPIQSQAARSMSTSGPSSKGEGERARSPGELTFFDELHKSLVQSKQSERPAGSSTRREPKNDELPVRSTAPSKRPASPSCPPAHSAKLLQTPHGLVIHFDPHREAEPGEQITRRSKAKTFLAGETADAQVSSEDEEVDGGGEFRVESYRRLLSKFGKASRIRAIVEREEMRLLARLREHDAEVYQHHRRAELKSRIRWAVEEQNRLTREAEDLMAIADEKYERVSQVGKLLAAAERSLEALDAARGEQVESTSNTGANASAVERLVRDAYRAGKPGVRSTDDEKNRLGLDRYVPDNSDNVVQPRWFEEATPLSAWQSRGQVGRDKADIELIEPGGVRFRTVKPSQRSKPPPPNSRRTVWLSDFQRESQADGDWDMDAATRHWQGFNSPHYAEVGPSGSFERVRDAEPEQGGRERNEERWAIEELINRAYPPAKGRDRRGNRELAGGFGLSSACEPQITGDEVAGDGMGSRYHVSLLRPIPHRSDSSKSLVTDPWSAVSFAESTVPWPYSIGAAAAAPRPSSSAVYRGPHSRNSQRLQQRGNIADHATDLSTGHSHIFTWSDENRRDGRSEARIPRRGAELSGSNARAASPARSGRLSIFEDGGRSPSRESGRSTELPGMAASSAQSKSPRLSTSDAAQLDGSRDNMTVTITPARHAEERKCRAQQEQEKDAAARKISSFLRNRLDTSQDRQILHNLRLLAQKEREIRLLKEGTTNDQPHNQEQLVQLQDDQRTPSLTSFAQSQPRHKPVNRALAFAEPISVVLQSIPDSELAQYDRDSALPGGSHVHPRHHEFLAYEGELNRLLSELDGVESSGSEKVRDHRKRLVNEVNDLLAEVDAKKREAYAAARRQEAADGENGTHGVCGTDQTAGAPADGEAVKVDGGSWDKLSELNSAEK